MSFALDMRSLGNLQGVKPELVRVAHKAASLMPHDLRFVVTEGLRTQQRQAQLLKAGASRTSNSRHLTGDAFDVAALIDLDGDGKWEVRWDWPLYQQIATVVKLAAKAEGVDITWGGDWARFRDGPHFELTRPKVQA